MPESEDEELKDGAAAIVYLMRSGNSHGLRYLTDDYPPRFPPVGRSVVVSKYNARVLKVINQRRRCEGYIPWMQGFHPKEHTEMLLNKEMLRAQKRHANISLAVAVSAVLVGATFTYHSATIGAEATMSGAKMQAEARMKTIQMQIEAQKDMAAKAPPINVTIQMPEGVSRKR